MSTLGLSSPPEKSDGLWKGLFWPTIHNGHDADLAATRGFWICLALAFVTSGVTTMGLSVSVGITVDSWIDLALMVFYLLGAAGVREGSLSASISIFLMYLFGTVVYFVDSPLHFNFFRLVFLALLLTNVRAVVLITQWRRGSARDEDLAYAPDRMDRSWRDKLVDQLPARIWPWGRYLFYLLAAVIVPLELLGVTKLLFRPA